MKNSYLGVAVNEYAYLNAVRHLKYYNSIAVQCQQVVEKLLKSVVELSVPDVSTLHTHNLKKLYYTIDNIIELDKETYLMLSNISSYYYDARYPGENFIEVSESDLLMTLDAVDIIYRVVIDWHKQNGSYNIGENPLISAANMSKNS